MENPDIAIFDFRKYLTAGVVLSAITQLSFVFYFQNFGVQPTQFFNVTEILIAAARDFVIILFILFVILNTYAIHVGPSQWEYQDQIKLIENKRKRWLKTHLNDLIQLTVFLVFAIVLWYKGLDPSFYIIFITMMLVTKLLNYNQKTLHKMSQTNPANYNQIIKIVPRTNLRYIYLGVLLIILVWFLAKIKADHALTNNKYIGSVFQIQKKEIIMISKDNLLIGRSSDYIFVFSPKSRLCRIIRRSDLTYESLKLSNDVGIKGFLMNY